MTDSMELERRLDQLGRDLQSGPKLADSIMAKINRDPVHSVEVVSGRSRFRTMAIVTAIACSVALAISLIPRPSSVYARAISALQQARTIHVIGWTTRVPRDWPLERQVDVGANERHDVDMWFWRSVDGTTRGLEKVGPVTKLRTGTTVEEYQQDTDLLFINNRQNNDPASKFMTIAAYLRQLQDGKQTDLGTKMEDGKRMRGVKVERHNRIDEYWFDVRTDLPIRFSRKQKDQGEENSFELQFSYDDDLPDAVAAYVVPKAKNVRYGRGHQDVGLAWKQHVNDLWQTSTPTSGSVLVARRNESQGTFAHQWTLSTPDGKYWVVPIDRDQYEPMNIDHFLRLRVCASNGDCDVASWRVADPELLELEFPRCDVMYEHGTDWRTWVQHFFNEVGLEFVDVVEQRTHWLAQHDGRKLKPWEKVQPPVPYLMRDGKPSYGVLAIGRGRSGSPATITRLFDEFNEVQNNRYTAKQPVIIDETGLPRPVQWDSAKYPQWRDYYEAEVKKCFVATDSPYFDGSDGQKMACEWFEKEFGITFKEETRAVTVHVIRKK
ncbi:MAG: hypothetical protein R3E01_22725 [Pirellulaceae bacterium]|nr:hypothetical protein [Planctomycetales bacterium]